MHKPATLPPGLHRRIVGKRNALAAHQMTPAILKDLEKNMQVEFVYNSNGIEGVALSRCETELALRGITVHGKSITDFLAAQNHGKALALVRDFALGKELKECDILEIHRTIMAGIISTAGQYRRGDVRIAGASFSPPPAYEVEGHVRDLIKYVNVNPDELRPIELAAHAHYYIAWIHPFDDGNGRIARLLTNVLLARNRYPFAVIRKVERKKYINLLDTVSRTGDFESFLVYIARCVEQTLDIYLNAAKGARSKEKLLPLSVLAKSTPYSAEYLSLQARKGVLDAVKAGRVWMGTKRTIKAYMREHGRK
jgi:Fic family protein